MAKSQFDQFLNSKQASILLPTGLGLISLVLWEFGVKIFQVPVFILPPPSQILGALNQWGEVLMKHSLITLTTTLAGFVAAVFLGVVLGSIIGNFRIAYLSIYPLLVGFNTIPKVAIVPLLAIWFGVGTVPAIITAFLLAFFPIAVNVALGLETVEPEMKDVLNSLGASKWETFQKVGLPHSLPYLFASLKIAISSAFIGSVISETVASNGGLGYLIVSASSSFDVPLAFLGLLALAVMGVILYTFSASLERYILVWKR